MDQIDKRNLYAKKLISLKDEHIAKVDNLVINIKKSDKLNWKKFSEDLDEIKQEYNGLIQGLISGYMNDFKQILNENLYSDKTIEFSDYCNKKFDEVYNEFEERDSIE